MSKPTNILPGGAGEAWRKTTLESGGLAVAEVLSGGISLGAFTFLEDILPNKTNEWSKALAKSCIEPNLDWFERNLQKVCHLQECKPDMNKSREQRAEEYARTIVKFSASLGVNIAAKLAVRKLWNNYFKLENAKEVPADTWWAWFKSKMPQVHDLKVLALDEGSHLGALYLVNNTGAKYTDASIRSISDMLQSTTGCSKKRADEMASMIVVWEMPNMVGLGFGSAAIASEQFKNHGVSWAEGIKHAKDATHQFFHK